MRPIIALVAAAILIAGMFLFSAVMLRQLNVWANQGAALLPGTRLLLNIAEAWTNYWYLGVAAIMAVCMAVVRFTVPHRDDRS